MNGWIIYPRYVGERSDNAFGWLTETAGEYGIELSVMFSEDLTPVYGDGRYSLWYKDGEVACYPDFVVMRDYQWVLSRHFELRGIPVINNSLAMMLCRNKMLTHQLLSDAGIPTPTTVFNHAGEYEYAKLCPLFGSRRFIVKRIDGAKGEGVFLVGNAEELHAASAECGAEHICQRFVEESCGRDVRVWVIGGKAVAAVLRYSETSFKSNFSQGGKVGAFELTPEVSALAERAAEALGLEFAGIDLLFTAGGFTVCEVNGNAGFRTLSKTGANNIPAELFKYINHKFITHN